MKKEKYHSLIVLSQNNKTGTVNGAVKRKILLRKLIICSSHGMDFVPYENIVYCEANRNYTKFYLSDNQSLLACQTLKEFEKQLLDHGFFRIHKSRLINLHRVVRYLKEDGGFVVMDNGAKIGISKRKKAEFLNLF